MCLHHIIFPFSWFLLYTLRLFCLPTEVLSSLFMVEFDIHFATGTLDLICSCQSETPRRSSFHSAPLVFDDSIYSISRIFSSALDRCYSLQASVYPAFDSFRSRSYLLISMVLFVYPPDLVSAKCLEQWTWSMNELLFLIWMLLGTIFHLKTNFKISYGVTHDFTTSTIFLLTKKPAFILISEWLPVFLYKVMRQFKFFHWRSVMNAVSWESKRL